MIKALAALPLAVAAHATLFPAAQATAPQVLDDRFLAVLIEAVQRRQIAPIPVDHRGGDRFGFVYDRAAQIALAARLAADRGAPLTPETVPAALLNAGLVIVVPPPVVDGAAVLPTGATITTAKGQALTPELVDGAPRLAELVPGAAAVADGIVARFAIVGLGPGDVVRLTYAARVSGSGPDVALPVQVVPPRKIRHVNPTYPPGPLGAGVVGRVEADAIVDVEGRVRFPRILVSVPALDASALDAVEQWRFEPPRVNGVARSTRLTLSVAYTIH